jgi:hypothetical protein
LHVFIYLSPRSYKYPTGEARKCLDAHAGTAQKTEDDVRMPGPSR